MPARDRVQKYRQSGGAADLVRVEVLVPSARRGEIVANAARMRAEHRALKHRLDTMCTEAAERYAVRIFDNIDLSLLRDPRQKTRVIANALIERGDARAFVMGRRMLAELEG